jgi:hypothetical protein
MIIRLVRPWLRTPRIYTSTHVHHQFFQRTIQTHSRPRPTQLAEDALFDHEIEEDEDNFVDDLAEDADDLQDTGNGQTGGQMRARPKGWVEPEVMRAAKREVVWLMADKSSLAKRIQEALDNRQVELAETITRLASKGKDEAVVAWNLLIKHQMAHKPYPHHDVALKLYNEVLGFSLQGQFYAG